LRVDGKESDADVDLARSTVQIGAVVVPFRVVEGSAGVVQVELGGEILTVDGWPTGLGVPPAALTVSGEVVAMELLSRSTRESSGAPPTREPQPSVSNVNAGAAPAPITVAGAVPVLPPMPGKIVEVRVRDGQQVRRGEVLLVLEAMKMRNEVPSPTDGEVTDVAVRPGDNASTKRPMLFVRPRS
jgi:biotin carboxyl carrier protein